MNLDIARRYLLEDTSDDLIAFMAGHSVALDHAADSQGAKAKAIELGWINPDTGRRTDQGILASDSCREYLFWQGRNKQLPFENGLPHLARSTFEKKYVCEIGAGMGANLMSLSQTTARLCGVEPVGAYIDLGAIFREREGMQPIEMRLGGAENLPFDADELDLVLLVSAHQYFDIHVALREIARVLRPGGELILIGGTLSKFSSDIGRQVIRGKSDLKGYVMTILNTLSYTAAGRRIIPSRGNFSTARPVYPPRSAMIRWMKAYGFTQRTTPGAIANETCFFAQLDQ